MHQFLGLQRVLKGNDIMWLYQRVDTQKTVIKQCNKYPVNKTSEPAYKYNAIQIDNIRNYNLKKKVLQLN